MQLKRWRRSAPALATADFLWPGPPTDPRDLKRQLAAALPPLKRHGCNSVGRKSQGGIRPMSITVRPESLSAADAQSSALRQTIERLSLLETPALLAAAIGGALGGKVAVVSSFGAESAVVLALTAEIDRTVPVIFLDTGKHFPETLAYRDALVEHLRLTDLRVVHPPAKDLTQFDPDGRLWSTALDHCCFLRKVMPLDRALV